jgi:hypothetical protein
MFIVAVSPIFRFYNELFTHIMEMFDDIIYVISKTNVKNTDKIINIIYSDDIHSKVLATIFCDKLQTSKFASLAVDITPSFIKKDRFVMYVNIPEEKYGFL